MIATQRALCSVLAMVALCPLAVGQLSGPYTVGSGGAFADMTSAIAALNSQGVAGPVTFNVTSNQAGSWTISGFPGQGPANPVVFEGFGTADLSGASTILSLSGCQNVTISGFTATYGTSEAFRIQGGATNCIFTGCTFLTGSNTSTSANRAFTISGGINCRIEDSTFGGGYEAFNYSGSSTGCTIQRCRVLSGGFWIAQISAPAFTFQNNFVWGNANYGFRGGPGSVGLKVYNNSFYITHAGAVGQGCSLRWYTLETTEVVNNAFHNINANGSGHIMWCSGTNRPTIMDNNCYNLQNGLSIMYSTMNHTLTSWQQATGLDGASIEADPMFINTAVTPPDLHITQSSPCALAGQTLPSVVDDIDGSPRVPNYDIGAHEATAANLLVATTSGGGDIFLALTMISPNAARGFTLLSFDVQGSAGTGPVLGLYPDSWTFYVFTIPQFAGNPFNFPVGPASVFPAVPFTAPSGALANLIGTSCDVVCVVLDGNTSLIGRSNVVRVNW